jgi:uncharacterized membrane protein
VPCIGARQAPAFTALVYAAGSVVCHQRADRSFASCGLKWPVCGRCSGLYLGAAAGALLASFGLRWRQSAGRWRRVLLLAAAPTLLSWTVETATRLDPGTAFRFAAALPLGLATALWLAEVARGDLR